MKIGYDSYQSPIGRIHVVVDTNGVQRVEVFEEDWKTFHNQNKELELNYSLCRNTIIQLDEYFSGKRKSFTVPLSLCGTPFQHKVWSVLQQIPYGQVWSYADVAIAIGNPKAVRAIGQANKSNKLPILIPCHRVIGKSGELMGYAGSRTSTKRLLLVHEGVKLER